MIIYQNIYDYLSAQPEFSGIDILFPDGDITTKNGIIYRLIADPVIYESHLKHQTWRFFINNQSKSTCLILADELNNHFNQFRGDLAGKSIQYIIRETNESPIMLQNLETYQIIQDYIINIIE
jgi:hypothetical protein